MTLRLKRILAEAGIKQGALASAIRLSRPALNGLINHNVLPAAYVRAEVDTDITRYLREHANGAAWADWHLQEEPPCVNTAAPSSPSDSATNESPDEEIQMLLRKHTLTPQARRHFGLSADPFADPTSADEVFWTPDSRYVRESMFQLARNGGFIAVVGESGSGKTTLREELNDRLQREAQSVTVIEPYVLATEDKDAVGKPLRSQHIAEAIMACVDPMAKTKSSPEARFRQLHEALRQSARAGHRHLLIIEEAHSLPTTTLKHLKRFMELKDGLRPLMAILLIAQPELLVKLSASNAEIREVMQRLEIISLPPLGKYLDEYLAHRFKRAGRSIEKVFDSETLDALRARLTPSAKAEPLLYPLVVHNALAAAMNRAVDLCMPVVTADLVRGA